MRWCKLDWKPDTGTKPRVVTGTRTLYVVDTGATPEGGKGAAHEARCFAMIVAQLSRDMGVDEARLAAMIQEGGLEKVFVLAEGRG
jgi:hypothetical protein